MVVHAPVAAASYVAMCTMTRAAFRALDSVNRVKDGRARP